MAKNRSKSSAIADSRSENAVFQPDTIGVKCARSDRFDTQNTYAISGIEQEPAFQRDRCWSQRWRIGDLDIVVKAIKPEGRSGFAGRETGPIGQDTIVGTD